MDVRIEPMAATDLDAARALLAEACPFDDAASVAEEKLCAPGPQAPVRTWLAWRGSDAVGVVAVSGRWVRMLAVRPDARDHGVGGSLLALAEDVLRADRAVRARALDQPGNYLSPGIDERNRDAIAWLTRRGWVRDAAPVENLIVDVRTNPLVSPARAAELADELRAKGYEIRRAVAADGPGIEAAVAREFGGAWPWELARALEAGGLHAAWRDGQLAGFAAHDGNNRGRGWFGPAGTWPAHRGQGVGEALLLACLVDVAVDHAISEIAWIGPRRFYERAAGVIGARRFWPMHRTLT